MEGLAEGGNGKTDSKRRLKASVNAGTPWSIREASHMPVSETQRHFDALTIQLLFCTTTFEKYVKLELSIEKLLDSKEVAFRVDLVG